jgi:hypothetical protein
MIESVKARVRVKVATETGRYCLREIHGLKEGTILEGRYCPINKSFDFVWDGEPAMLWVGDNAELVVKETKHGFISSPRNNLRKIILRLNYNEYVKLDNPVTIIYCSNDLEFMTQIKITEVGCHGKASKLVSEFNQLFSLNDASERECAAIIDALPDYMKTI